MKIVQTQSPQDFLAHALSFVQEVISETNDVCTIGLSGGSTPVPLYKALFSLKDKMPWDRLHFLLFDERFVPPSHADSNTFLIKSTLLPEGQSPLLAPNTTLSIDKCVEEYDTALTSITPDLVLLGMGEDGHIASLFPPLSPLAFGPSDVIHTTTDQFVIPDRISVTLPFLERAKKRLFLISGEKKVKLLRSQEHENQDPSMFPAHALFDERTTWLIG